MTPPNPPQMSPDASKHVRFNLLVLGLVVAFVGIGAAYFIDFKVRNLDQEQNVLDSAFRIEKIVAGEKLSVPQAWLTYPDQTNEGFVDRLDLTLPVQFSGSPESTTINVTFLPRSRLKLSANLLDSVYLHRFTATRSTGPSGLFGKRLADEAGYQGETVWFDPISGQPFVAKCDDEDVAVSTSKCLRTIKILSGLGMTMVFDADLLIHWREIDTALETPLAVIGAGAIN